MHITQGTFSYLPPLTDDEIRMQVQYGLDKDWHPHIEYTDDPHPRNIYWDMWGMPMFDLEDATAVVNEINRCRETHPNTYIRVTLYDAHKFRATSGMQFIVQRPDHEPGFRVTRQDRHDRAQTYGWELYEAQKPHGTRYGNGSS